MAQKIAKQAMAAYWLQQNGPFTAATPFQLGQAGLGDITLPGPGDRTIFFGTNAMGLPVSLGFERGASGQPGTSLENYVTLFRDTIQKMREQGQVRNIQLRIHDGTSLDNPNLWKFVVHLEGGQAGDSTLGAPVSREFGDARIPQATPYVPYYGLILAEQSLSRLTTTEAQAANGVAFLSDPESLKESGNGYPGPDRIGYIGCDAVGAGTANVLSLVRSATGTWTIAATSADPFAADEHIDFPMLRMINKTQFRLVVARITTDAAAPSEIAYANVTIGAETTTTWSTVNVGSNNGDIVTATIWPSYGRMYVANDNNDIFLSTDQGESWTDMNYGGSNAPRAFALAPGGENLYVVGDSNEIYVEKAQSGTWESLTGPTGSNNSNAIAVGRDAIWLGNGTSLFYSENLLPTAAGQWTSSKDFGTNHQARDIHLPTNALTFGSTLVGSQVVKVLVNDTSGNEGDVWKTLDGGGTWLEVTNLANSGLNNWYYSPIDPNFAVIVGEVNSSTALIHKLDVAGGV